MCIPYRDNSGLMYLYTLELCESLYIFALYPEISSTFDKISKIPYWITQYIEPICCNQMAVCAHKTAPIRIQTKIHIVEM